MIARRALLALAAPFLLAAPVLAHSFSADKVMIGHPWAQPAARGGDASAFVSLLNGGREKDRLIHATTDVATRATLRDVIDGQVRPVELVAVEPGKPVPMRPGARDIHLRGLTRDLALGDRFTLTLVFEKAGRVDVEVFVEESPGH